jgi:hypothetical protein
LRNGRREYGCVVVVVAVVVAVVAVARKEGVIEIW